MEIKTLGELLHWSYANLAMAHAAVSGQAQKYSRIHFMIRAKLFAGLKKQTTAVGSLMADERLKMILPQACCYCGGRDYLSIDHLVARNRGGSNSGENLVWACRSCNSSKGDQDVLEWLAKRNQFPPLLLLRRYLKLAIELCHERCMVDTPLEQVEDFPFALETVPRPYPQPTELTLWVIEII